MNSTNKLKRNIFLNSSISFVFKLSSILFAFVSRYCFIKYLGIEYSGINAVISNILSMLSLSEFGLNAAILSRLYLTISKNKTQEAGAYYYFYKRTYKMIGSFIFFVGIFFMPFLSIVIKANFINIYFVFILYLLISVQSYFFSSSTILLEAYQEKYIWTIIHYIFYYLIQIFQILSLVLFKNYYLYILINLFFSIAENLVITKYVKKKYPLKKEILVKKEKRNIYSDCGALFIHKLSGVIVFSTDNFLIAYFTSIAVAGMYDNYYLIINNLSILIKEVIFSLRGVVGNIIASKSINEAFEYFKLFNFVAYMLISFITINSYVLFNDFICFWLGKDMLLSNFIVFFISLNFYLTSMRYITLLFKEGKGIFKDDVIKAILEALFNLVFSIFLGINMGIVGVLIGTSLSTLLTSSWYEPYLIYKSYFKQKFYHFYLEYIRQFVSVLIIGLVVNKIVSAFIKTILYKFVFSALLTFILLIMFNCYKNEFKFFVKYFIRRLKNE